MNRLGEVLGQISRHFDGGASTFYRQVRGSVPIPESLLGSRTDAYYAALSYLRLHAPNAIIELERQAAEYKLFRSLFLVALVDVPLSFLGGYLSPRRAVAVLVLTLAAGWRFVNLLNWAYRLAFEFFALATREPARVTVEV